MKIKYKKRYTIAYMYTTPRYGMCNLFTIFFVGHTTVKMMERLMANTDVLTTIRDSFHSRNAFNVHPTSKHREQDPFPDQLKAAHFILGNKLVKPDLERKVVRKFPDAKNASVTIANIDAYESGKKKVLENFDRKLFTIYGIMKDDESDESEPE